MPLLDSEAVISMVIRRTLLGVLHAGDEGRVNSLGI